MTYHTAKAHRYIYQKPFKGYFKTYTFLENDKEYVFTYNAPTVNGVNIYQTVEEYLSDHSLKEIEFVADADYDKFIRAYLETLKTEPVEIPVEKFHEMLNILPPERWTIRFGISVFHICERLTHNLVSWYALCDGKACTWVDGDYVTEEQVFTKLYKFFREVEHV